MLNSIALFKRIYKCSIIVKVKWWELLEKISLYSMKKIYVRIYTFSIKCYDRLWLQIFFSAIIILKCKIQGILECCYGNRRVFSVKCCKIKEMLIYLCHDRVYGCRTWEHLMSVLKSPLWLTSSLITGRPGN